jgi:hypothetical protein
MLIAAQCVLLHASLTSTVVGKLGHDGCATSGLGHVTKLFLDSIMVS